MNTLKDKVKNQFSDKWWDKLSHHFDEDYMILLYDRILRNIRQNKEILPSSKDIYKRFKLINPDDVRIVFLTELPICSYKQSKEWQKISQLIEYECYEGLNLNLEDNMDYLISQGIIHLSPSLTLIDNKEDLGWLKFYNDILTILMCSDNKVLFVTNHDKYYYDIKLEEGCFKKINEWMIKEYNTKINW